MNIRPVTWPNLLLDTFACKGTAQSSSPQYPKQGILHISPIQGQPNQSTGIGSQGFAAPNRPLREQKATKGGGKRRLEHVDIATHASRHRTRRENHARGFIKPWAWFYATMRMVFLQHRINGRTFTDILIADSGIPGVSGAENQDKGLRVLGKKRTFAADLSFGARNKAPV